MTEQIRAGPAALVQPPFLGPRWGSTVVPSPISRNPTSSESGDRSQAPRTHGEATGSGCERGQMSIQSARMNIFISYSRVDSDVVSAIEGVLSDCGISYFLDIRGIEWGASIQ